MLSNEQQGAVPNTLSSAWPLFEETVDKSVANISYVIRRQCPAKTAKFSLAFFQVIYQMPPLSWIKRSIEQNKRTSLKIKCRIASTEVDYSS